MTLLTGKEDAAGLAETRDIEVELMVLLRLRVVLNAVLGIAGLPEGRLGGVLITIIIIIIIIIIR